MCTSIASGGARCAAHARTTLSNALAQLEDRFGDDARTLVSPLVASGSELKRVDAAQLERIGRELMAR